MHNPLYAMAPRYIPVISEAALEKQKAAAALRRELHQQKLPELNRDRARRLKKQYPHVKDIPDSLTVKELKKFRNDHLLVDKKKKKQILKQRAQEERRLRKLERRKQRKAEEARKLLGEVEGEHGGVEDKQGGVEEDKGDTESEMSEDQEDEIEAMDSEEDEPNQIPPDEVEDLLSMQSPSAVPASSHEVGEYTRTYNLRPRTAPVDSQQKKSGKGGRKKKRRSKGGPEQEAARAAAKKKKAAEKTAMKGLGKQLCGLNMRDAGK